MKYFFVAGEQSGDLHGAELIKQILQKETGTVCFAYGGDRMQSAGAMLLANYKDTQYMGIWDVFIHLPKIFHRLNSCKQDIAKFKPEIVVLIDNPSFNLRIANFCRKSGIKTAWYISPKIWAWNFSRIYHLKKFVDHMLVIFPFEQRLYEKVNLRCTYVGNPTVNLVDEYLQTENKITKFSEGVKIALLPGSRPKEIKRILPIFKKLVLKCPDWHFTIVGTQMVNKELYLPIMNIDNVEIHFDQTFQTLSNCDLAIVTSGTATLEAAILNTPQVIVYKTDWITYFAAKLLVKSKWIGLPNILLNRLLIKEFIQWFSAEDLKIELLSLLNPDKKEELQKGNKEIREILGNRNAAENAAYHIIRLSGL